VSFVLEFVRASYRRFAENRELTFYAVVILGDVSPGQAMHFALLDIPRRKNLQLVARSVQEKWQGHQPQSRRKRKSVQTLGNTSSTVQDGLVKSSYPKLKDQFGSLKSSAIVRPVNFFVGVRGLPMFRFRNVAT
jgi:hypothetical protein